MGSSRRFVFGEKGPDPVGSEAAGSEAAGSEAAGSEARR